MTLRAVIVCGMALVTVAAAAPVPEQTARLARAATVVSHSYSFPVCFTPEESAAMRALEGIPDEDIDALLRSEDAHLIGVGLYLADERQLPEFFLRYPEILRDRRPSPLVRCSNQWHPPEAPAAWRYGSMASMVAAQYSAYLSDWYGVWAHDERMFHEHIAPDADPWQELQTWNMLIERAFHTEDPARVDEVRERILRAPESVRWIVLARLPLKEVPGGPPPLFTKNEAQEAMRALDPDLRRAIREGSAPLPPRLEKAIASEEAVAAKAGGVYSMRTELYESAKRLLDD